MCKLRLRNVQNIDKITMRDNNKVHVQSSMDISLLAIIYC